MILDPRLVPWSDLVPGVGIALVLAVVGYLLWRWRIAALTTLALAPVAGWTASFYNLQGSVPAIPPGDATQWVLYFAIAGAIIAAAALLLSRSRWWSTAALLMSVGFIAAIWATLLRPVAVPDETGTSMRGPALFLAWLGCLLAMDIRNHSSWLAAEYAPWLTALLAASVCLALTGTASVSTLALALCLMAVPAAIAVLARRAVPEAPAGQAAPLTGEAQNNKEPVPDTQPAVIQWQAITLPLAVSLPLLILSGALYASTPWVTTCLVLATPVVGLTALRLFGRYRARHDRLTSNLRNPLRMELLAIAIALITAAVPAGIAAYQTISSAAAEEPFY